MRLLQAKSQNSEHLKEKKISRKSNNYCANDQFQQKNTDGGTKQTQLNHIDSKARQVRLKICQIRLKICQIRLKLSQFRLKICQIRLKICQIWLKTLSAIVRKTHPKSTRKANILNFWQLLNMDG